jgi:hypothetical protein
MGSLEKLSVNRTIHFYMQFSHVTPQSNPIGYRERGLDATPSRQQLDCGTDHSCSVLATKVQP